VSGKIAGSMRARGKQKTAHGREKEPEEGCSPLLSIITTRQKKC
jgi:hypothetical protein